MARRLLNSLASRRERDCPPRTIRIVRAQRKGRLTHTRELTVIVGATFRPLLSGVPRRRLELQKALLRFCRERWRSPGLLLVPVLAVIGLAECELVLPLAAKLLLWGDHPPLARFLQETPPTIGRIEDGRGVLLVELARQHRQPFEAHELPPVLVNALDRPTAPRA